MKEYQDFYFRKAKAEHYPARSVYKLKEIDSKFNLLFRGMKALDLGAAPGSWTLALAEKAGPDGIILACDLKAAGTEFPPQVRYIVADIFEPGEEFAASLASIGPFDLVVSDMAPATTGSRFTDQARSYNLAQAAFELAKSHLRQGGHFIVKIFMGPDVKILQDQMRGSFERVKAYKPKSSRSESKETFLIGINHRAPAQAE